MPKYEVIEDYANDKPGDSKVANSNYEVVEDYSNHLPQLNSGASNQQIMQDMMQNVPGTETGKLGHAALQVGKDIVHLPAEAINKIPDAYHYLIKNVPAAVKMAFHHPTNAGRNILYGNIIGTGIDVANIPSLIWKYGEHLGLADPGKSDWIHINKSSIMDKLIGHTEQPGEGILRNLIGIAGGAKLGLNAASLAGKGVYAAGKGAAKGAINISKKLPIVGDTITTASKKIPTEMPKFQDTSALSNEATQLGEHLEQIKAHLAKEGLPETVNALSKKIYSVKQEMTPLQKKISSYKPESKFDANITSVENAQKTLDKAHLDKNDIESNASISLENLKDHLNNNESHSELIGAQLKTKLDEHKKSFTDRYKDQEEKLKDRNAMVTIPGDAEKIAEDLKSIEGIGSHVYAKNLDKLMKLSEKKMPAHELLGIISGVKADLRDLYKKTSSGNHPDIQALARAKIDRVNGRLKQLNESLRDAMTDEEYKNYNKLNEDYREKMIPLYKDPHYHKIINDQLSDDNIMKKLRGEGKSNKVLKELIRSDPNIVRNVIGQKFSDKPEQLLNADKVTQSYLNHDPELADKLDTHRSNLHDVRLANENVKNAEQTINASQKNAGIKEEDRKKAQEIQDAYQDLVKKQNKIKKIQMRQKELREKELKYTLANKDIKNIDLANKQLEEDFKRDNNEVMEARKKLKAIAKTMGLIGLAKIFGIMKMLELMAILGLKNKGDN